MKRLKEKIESLSCDDMLQYRANAFIDYPELEIENFHTAGADEDGLGFCIYNGREACGVQFEKTHILVRYVSLFGLGEDEYRDQNPAKLEFVETLEPHEVEEAAETLVELRKAANTVISVEEHTGDKITRRTLGEL